MKAVIPSCGAREILLCEILTLRKKFCMGRGSDDFFLVVERFL